MDRLKGVGSFVAITLLVLGSLRAVHVVTPLLFPATRLGPIDVRDLGEVRRLAGFTPLLPAYRPSRLGAAPESMQVTLSPRPTFRVTWRAGRDVLTVAQYQGGSRPAQSPVSESLIDVPDSEWWMDGDLCHLVLERGAFWVEIQTSLSPAELKRFADTLSPF